MGTTEIRAQKGNTWLQVAEHDLAPPLGLNQEQGHLARGGGHTDPDTDTTPGLQEGQSVTVEQSWHVREQDGAGRLRAEVWSGEAMSCCLSIS